MDNHTISVKFLPIKVIVLIPVIIGLILAASYFMVEAKNYQEWDADQMTYSFVNPFDGQTYYHDGQDIAEMSLLKYIISGRMPASYYVPSVIIFAGFVIFALITYAIYFNQELTITESSITGKAVLGKEVDIPFSRIASVKKALLKGISLKTTGQDIVRFRLLANQSELIESISNQIQPTVVMSASERTEDSPADQIRKYKELMDLGVITQEEFIEKKKQLLGL